MLNLKYTYEWQRTRISHFFDKKLSFKENLFAKEVANCIALPIISKDRALGMGGLVDGNGKPVRESWMHWGNNKVAMGGAYEFNPEKISTLPDDNYIYLGYFISHYGHMLNDSSTRLYAIKKFKGFKAVVLLKKDQDSGQLPAYLVRFLELSGLNYDDIFFITQPTLIKKIIIPEESYRIGVYYSKEYIDTFKTISSNIRPTQQYKFDKVYFSRTQFNSLSQKEIGNQLIDFIFEKLGFKIVFPEKLPLDDQISLLLNAKEYGCIQSTLIHNLVFCQKKTTKIYIINRSYEMLPQFFDTFFIMNFEPVFLDFYILKYPTRFFYGPFIFANNLNMQNFIQDNKIDIDDSHFFSKKYLVKSLYDYEGAIVSTKFTHQRLAINISDDPLDGRYFDLNFIRNWLDIYSPLLIASKNYLLYGSPMQMENYFKSTYNMINDLFNLIPDGNICHYRLHLSYHGWTSKTLNGHICGFTNNINKIQAIILHFPTDFAIFYQVYYEDLGWQAPVPHGYMAGCTDQKKMIQGLKIICNSHINCEIKFRLFSDRWSQFKNINEEIINMNGFDAMQLIFKSSDSQGL